MNSDTSYDKIKHLDRCSLGRIPFLMFIFKSSPKISFFIIWNKN
jgi:hypothetical protein